MLHLVIESVDHVRRRSLLLFSHVIKLVFQFINMLFHVLLHHIVLSLYFTYLFPKSEIEGPFAQEDEHRVKGVNKALTADFEHILNGWLSFDLTFQSFDSQKASASNGRKSIKS